jgi:tetratricopeptide (TPR) repeat protein
MASKKQDTKRKQNCAKSAPDHDQRAEPAVSLSKGQANEQPQQQSVLHSPQGVKDEMAEREQSPISQSLIRDKRLSIIQKIIVISIILIATMLLYMVFGSQSRTKSGHGAERTNQISTSKEQTYGELACPERSRRVEPIPVATQRSATADSQLSRSESAEGKIDGSTEIVQPYKQIIPISRDAVSSAPVENLQVEREASSLSLRTAETLYKQRDFKKAYDVFNQLRRNLTADPEDDPLRDFLQLKMALCLNKAGDVEFAKAGAETDLFRAVLQSRFPIIRIIINYHQCIDLLQKKQYLKAQTKAYQTIALIDAVDWSALDEKSDELDQPQQPAEGGFDPVQGSAMASQLARDCHFLAVECLTKEVLSLRDADKDLPSKLWSHNLEFDPIVNLSDEKLQRFLNSGSKQLNKAVLAPYIQSIGTPSKVRGQDFVPRWEISCCSASIGELLARFAANADFDINWTCDSTEGLRNRPVKLYMSGVTAQQFVTVAAGCAGLLACFDNEGVVEILDPFDYTSLSEHIALLGRQAVSLWQRYILTFGDEERVANAHFAKGLLQEQQGHISEAVAEYKLMVNCYHRSSLAPFALLNSSKLKAGLHDYFGAREDLKQIVEQYPNSGLYDQACLYLAEASMKAGLLQEAAQLYRKVYNMSLSLESQRASILGAGKCFYEDKDYENADKWLTRYINSFDSAQARSEQHRGDSFAENRTNRDFCSACFLLGKANLALGKYEQACRAFQYTLAGQLPLQQYLETVLALVKTHIQASASSTEPQRHLVEAFKLLESTRSRQFSQEESIEILLLRASVLRSMGLFDEAVTILGDTARYLPDSQLKAKVFFEQSKCLIAKGDLKSARKGLTEILVFVEPGPLAYEVMYELADLCLKLNENTQVISISLQILNSEVEDTLKQKTSELLATAYTRQKDYDKAALALLGQWKTGNNTETKGDFRKQNHEDIISQGQVKQNVQPGEG